MSDPGQIAREVVRLWSDFVEVKGALEQDANGTINRVFPAEDPASTGARRTDSARRVIGPGAPAGPHLEAGLRALEKIKKCIERGEDPANAALEPDEALALELMYNFAARPAILFMNGRFMDPPPPWQELERHREQIESQAQKVGRVQLKGHRLPFAGTAFVVGEGLVMTNCHVAQAFARSVGGGWEFRADMGAAVTYGDDPDNHPATEFPVKRVFDARRDFDVAILELASGEGDLPAPMTFASVPLDASAQRKVYTMGYPARGRASPSWIDSVFEGIYNRKRLQPGQILRVSPGARRLYHDCSTLAGSSGSCVIDLETNLVVGVHSGGEYLKHNVAIELRYLRSFLKRAGVLFA